MALSLGATRVLPIGCSCIAQFQLELSPRLGSWRREAHLLDWVIATPEASAAMLRLRRPVVDGIDDLELLHDHVRSRVIEGLYFWHIKKLLKVPQPTPLQPLQSYPEGIAAMVAQHHHLVAKLDEPVDTLHCLWSNVQPNLQYAVGLVKRPWHDFVLTPARHRALVEACMTLPARRIHTWFVGRAEDVAPELHGAPDVLLLDLPRDARLYKGEPGLFDPVFERMGLFG